MICSNPVYIPDYSVVITTDASNLGWGAIFNGQSIGGRWSKEESNMHINELELLAIFLGLQSFLSNSAVSHARIQCDNATAVSYVNNFGGTRSVECHRLAKEIWSWALNKNIIYLQNIFLDLKIYWLIKPAEYLMIIQNGV